MDLKNIAFGLTLTASLVAGCGGDDTNTTTMTTPTTGMVNRDAGTCADAAAEADLYRITVITLPTADQVSQGMGGHNLDGLETVCRIEDGPGGIDNAVVGLLELLPSIPGAGDLDVQELITESLNCNSDACERVDLILSVRQGTGCAVAQLEDGEGMAISDEFVGTIGAGGAFRAFPASFDLLIPYPQEEGPTLQIELNLRNLILTGTLTEASVTNVLIGGVLPKMQFEATIMTLLGSLPNPPPFASIAGLLASLYDIQDSAGVCNGMSVGLTASAVAYTPPAAATR